MDLLAGAPLRSGLGVSQSWVAQTTNALRVWDTHFLPWLTQRVTNPLRELFGNWDGLSERLLCCIKIYERFAYYLTDMRERSRPALL